ncbi:carbohydrate ABC transporter permease [Paenarthrobacter sp. 4246]|uniref:carbohydrate ABC transporter permease n=1 Tax=Paenarthrobacter sp. 4246 TaxID=3156456 RepID=UPI003392CF73
MSIQTQTRQAAPAAPSRRNSAQNGSTIARVGGILALVILALMWLLPILWGVTTSLKSEEDAATSPFVAPTSGWNFDAYVQVLSQGDVPRWMLNSLGISIAVTVLTVGISALAAYGFSRMEFRGRKWLFAMTVASIMVPGQILIVPLYQQMNSMQLADTWAGIVLPQVVAPMMVFILKNFFDTIPKELEEAARIDGAGGLRVFFTIVMPLSRPILIAVSIFVFIGAWNNFLWPFIVTNNPDLLTLPVGLATIKNAYGVQYAQTMASAILAALPLLIMFMLFQRHIVKGFATSGLGGQ